MAQIEAVCMMVMVAMTLVSSDTFVVLLEAVLPSYGMM